jgi:hypothetical protein
MPMNTANIDAKMDALITEQRNHLKKLEDFKRLASDPEIRPFLESLITENGIASSVNQRRPGRPKGSRNKESKKGDLKTGVVKAISGISGRFTAPSVVKMMAGEGFKFAAKTPNIAVNGVLRKLAAKGVLRVAVEGSGRSPNQYERATKGSGD